MAEFKVRSVEEPSEKSQAQIEEELLVKHTASDTIETAEVITPEKSVIDTPNVIELKDEDVLSYLGKKFNKQITSFDELVKEKESEILTEDVSAFLKYKKETGRGIDDFVKLNRDFSKVDSDSLIKEYFTLKEEGLEPEDIELMMNEFSFDEDIDTDEEINKKKLERKKTLNKAKKFFNEQKEQYKLPLVSSEASVPNEEKEEFALYKQYIQTSKNEQDANTKKAQWFDQKSNELFSNEFKGFEFKIDDNKTLKFSPGDAAELKSLQSTPLNFINKFMDESGLIKDAAGYHRGLSMAMNPEKYAKFFYEQGISDATEGTMANIKNINMGERRVPQSISQSGVKVREVNQESGNGLRIKSIRKV